MANADKPGVTIYGKEDTNRLTGERRFVETGRERFDRLTYEEMKRDRRYIFMAQI